jgi:hypothetical protein
MFLLDLKRSVEGLERNREALVQELAKREEGVALEEKNAELAEEIGELERRVREWKTLEEEKGGLQMQFAGFEDLVRWRMGLEDEGWEVEMAVEEVERRWAGLRNEELDLERAVNEAERRVEAIEIGRMKGQFRKRLDDEITRIEWQIYDLETIADLGSALARDFGW